MILQILGTRMIGPQFGVGLFVWTSLITVAMMALALGYWLGGKWADRQPSFRSLALILLLAALWLAVTPLMRGAVLESSWNLGIRLGSLAAASALLFLPLCLLGMVTPFAVRLETDQIHRAGSPAGRILLESTRQARFDAPAARLLVDAATIADLAQADATSDPFCSDGAGDFPAKQQLTAWEIVTHAQASGRSGFLFPCNTFPAVVVKPFPRLPVF